MEKITKREMFEAIAEAMETGNCKYPPDAVIEFCNNEIDLLDKKAAKAKERAATKKAQSDELGDKVFAVLNDTEFQTIADITAQIDDEDATTSKVTYRLTQLVKNGKAEKSEITIPATETSKTRKVCGYRALNVEVED